MLVLEHIIEDYIDIENELVCAVEAQAGDTIIDNREDLSVFNKEISDRIDGIIKRALKKIDQDLAELDSRKKVLEGQAKAFNTEYNTMRANYQPMKSISIVNYQYDSNVLERQAATAKSLFTDAYNKFAGFISNPDRLKAKNNILGADYRRVISGILDKFNAPKDITTPEGIYSYTKDHFRGKKTNMQLGSGSITRYYAETRNISNIVGNAITELKDIRAKVANITRVLDAFVRSNANTQDHKKALPKVVRNFISLTNFYIGMIMYCFELRVEKVVNARVIIKAFYKKEDSKEVSRQKRIEGETGNDEGK